MADPFKFNQDFLAVDSDAIAKFQRSFTHIDWVDGESIVQAQDTPTEEGFNARFHKIEKDLDALGDDTKQAFSEINQMRSSLFALLSEIQAEFNRLRAVTAEPPNVEAARILTSKSNQLISGGYAAAIPQSPLDTQRHRSVCLRDLGYYFNGVVSSLQKGDTSIIDSFISGLREINRVNGYSNTWFIGFYQYIKANHGLTGDVAVVANNYLDRAINGLS